MTQQNHEVGNTSDLLDYLVAQMNSGSRDWFGYPQQKIVGIYVAYEMAIRHADVMTPEEVVNYVGTLNNEIFKRLIVGRNG